MDATLLQALEGLGEDPLVPSNWETWEWLQGEKERVEREILFEGPICQPEPIAVEEAEASEESPREVEWWHRSQLEARLREINDAQDRLMDGAYGRCTDCGAVIDYRRLAANPAIALCIECQRSTEVQPMSFTL
jgi:RNA polymerase-binding transcription factor DksA